MIIKTYPDEAFLNELVTKVPAHMHPSNKPYVVIVEGYLDDDTCNKILGELMEIEPHVMPGCGAETRECPMPLSSCLDPIFMLANEMNDRYWQFDLSSKAAAYMQTYMVGESYPMHIDGAPGQSRKLTAVALLSDPKDYLEGYLQVVYYPNTFTAPKTRGTIVLFPPWMLHGVTAVADGLRQTINMGFWGPPFK